MMVNHGVLSLKHQQCCPTAQCREIICIDEHGMCVYSCFHGYLKMAPVITESFITVCIS